MGEQRWKKKERKIFVSLSCSECKKKLSRKIIMLLNKFNTTLPQIFHDRMSLRFPLLQPMGWNTIITDCIEIVLQAAYWKWLCSLLHSLDLSTKPMYMYFSDAAATEKHHSAISKFVSSYFSLLHVLKIRRQTFCIALFSVLNDDHYLY